MTNQVPDTGWDSSCEFCEEFASRLCPFLTPPQPRFVYEDDDFLVFPSLGSFVPGYLLVSPRRHVPSAAWLTEDELKQLERILLVVKRIARVHYGDPIIYEHGMATCGRAGGCIEHAHIHVVPGTVDLCGILATRFSIEPVDCWTQLTQWRGHSYLLAQSDATSPVICNVGNDRITPQFLRKIVARALGLEDRWDWGAYLGLAEIRDTLERVNRAAFEDLDMC